MKYNESHIAAMYRTGYEDAISDMVEFVREFDEPIDGSDILAECEDLIAWAEDYEIPDDMLPKVTIPEQYMDADDIDYARGVEGSLRP